MILQHHIGSENDQSKISNVVSSTEENHTNTKDDENSSDRLNEPSECKIAKTIQEDLNLLELKIVYNKKKYDVSAPSNRTVADFKKQLQVLIGAPTQFTTIYFYKPI